MTDTTDMTGEQFSQGLKALGWRQVEFAERTGTSPSTVNRWISGHLPVPAWAVAHLRLLLAADQFHRTYVAPPSRSRRKVGKPVEAPAENRQINPEADKLAKAKSDLDAALGDLGNLLGNGTRVKPRSDSR